METNPNKTNRRHDTQMMCCLDRYCEDIRRNIKHITRRRNWLYDQIYAEFPPRDSHHFAAMALIGIYFPRTIQLIVLGSNALAYIEIYAVLEFFLLSDLPKKLAKDKAAYRIICKQIERKNLPELAEAAHELGLWDTDDISFIRHLAKIRNGLAHRNYNLLHKALGAPAFNNFEFQEKIDERIQKRDASGDLAKALRLIIKFTRHKRKRAANQALNRTVDPSGSTSG